MKIKRNATTAVCKYVGHLSTITPYILLARSRGKKIMVSGTRTRIIFRDSNDAASAPTTNDGDSINKLSIIIFTFRLYGCDTTVPPKCTTIGGERRVETSSPMGSRCGRLGHAAIFASRRAKRPHRALRMGASRYPTGPPVRPVLQVQQQCIPLMLYTRCRHPRTVLSIVDALTCNIFHEEVLLCNTFS